MSNFLADINPCMEVLQQGGIILYPTDTVWGIGCDATNSNAVSKIFALKKRAEEKSMVVLMAEERQINQYVSQPDFAVFDYLKKTTKPTTVIYNGAIGLAENAVNKDGTIAIRIVNEPFCKHLLKRFKRPIISTSANISGMEAPANYSQIDPAIINGVDYVVNYRKDDTTPAVPSAIIKWNADGTFNVIRP